MGDLSSPDILNSHMLQYDNDRFSFKSNLAFKLTVEYNLLHKIHNQRALYKAPHQNIWTPANPLLPKVLESRNSR